MSGVATLLEKTWLVPEFAELSPPSKNMKMPVERQIFWEITSLLWKFLLRQSHLLLKGTPLISCGCKWVSLVYFWCHESAFLIPGHWMIWSCGLPGSVTASRDMWRLKLLIVRSLVYRGSRVMVSIIFFFFEFSPWIHFFPGLVKSSLQVGIGLKKNSTFQEVTRVGKVENIGIWGLYKSWRKTMDGWMETSETWKSVVKLLWLDVRGHISGFACGVFICWYLSLLFFVFCVFFGAW